MRKVFILDTTLRDGVQSPAVTLTVDEKVEMARAIDDLGVDVIDCGYPGLSKTDFVETKSVVEAVEKAIPCVLARCNPKDIEAAFEAISSVGGGSRIHIFAPVSDIHLAHVARLNRGELLELINGCLEDIEKENVEVELTLEDAFRADRSFIREICDAVSSKVNVINISDTVGIATPFEVQDLVGEIIARLPENVILSIHCHDDLGLATANTLSAIKSGALQAHVTILGVGTRAGNASLEELVMILKLHPELGFYTDIDTTKLYKTVRVFSKIAGYQVPLHKAIVGDGAFEHKVEYQKLAVVREKSTYEIINPADIGYPKTRIVLSKYSGRIMFENKLKELGYDLDEEELALAYSKFKELSQKKREIYDDDIITIVEDVILSAPQKIKLESYSVNSASYGEPEARVVLTVLGEKREARSSGDGPVDAAFRAIDQAIGLSGRLLEYRVNAVTSGKDALGEVFIKVLFKGKEFVGRASATDILRASMEAYINAANKAL